ncbi:MAG TPA: hypothetical protein VGH34_22655 [Vicinamibacterales bacterium]
MARGHNHWLLTAALIAILFAQVNGAMSDNASPILQRFLALDDPQPTQFRALRHLEARNDHFDKSAWMDVWTEGDATGFTYDIVVEEGSEYIRSHVFREALEMERRAWKSGAPDRAGVTPANYVFAEGSDQPDGLTTLRLKPKRHDILLVEGAIFLNPEDGELVRMEGRLAKTPSFWTRRVQIVRRFQRIGGVRMPVALESVADVKVAGESTFKMTYEYESINGERVGAPEVRASLRRP